jgi:hypothetical protein
MNNSSDPGVRVDALYIDGYEVGFIVGFVMGGAGFRVSLVLAGFCITIIGYGLLWIGCITNLCGHQYEVRNNNE